MRRLLRVPAANSICDRAASFEPVGCCALQDEVEERIELAADFIDLDPGRPIAARPYLRSRFIPRVNSSQNSLLRFPCLCRADEALLSVTVQFPAEN